MTAYQAFLKGMVQTAVNGSFIGGLTGGDPAMIAHSSLAMAKANTSLTDPTGLGGDLGGQFSNTRTALASEMNKEVMSFFQDDQTGSTRHATYAGHVFRPYRQANGSYAARRGDAYYRYSRKYR